MIQFMNRHWKAIAGIALLLLAIVALVRNVVLINTQDAFINAYLSPIRSPIPGEITQALPPPGTRITPDTRVIVENHRPDETLLIETRERLATVDANLLEARVRAERLGESRAEFSAWADRFRSARDAFLRERESELQALIKARRQQHADAKDELARLQDHARFVPVRQIESARTRVEVTAEDLAGAQAQLRQLRAERQALEQRIQVADTFSERTFSDQKVQETALQLRLLDAEISSLEIQQEALRAAVGAAEAQLQRERSADIALPDAVVWQREPVGTHIARAGTLGSVALCSDLLITATLDRRAFQRVQVGDAARVRLKTSDGDVVRTGARVITLTGAAMENILGMAIPFGRATLEDAYGAVLRIDTPAAMNCAVGRSVTLRFSGD